MAGMTNCPYCGKLTDPKLENCPHCGGYLQKKDDSLDPYPKKPRAKGQSCPNCRALVNDGDIICVACGTNLLTGQKIAEQGVKPKADPGVRLAPAAERSTLKWLIVALIVVIILALALVVVAILSRDPLQKAVDLSRANNFLEAANVLRRHIERHPDDAEAQCLLGKVHWRMNQFMDAADAFERAARIDKTSPQTGLMAVLSLASQPSGDTLGRQAAILEDLFQTFPDDLDVGYLLALAQGVQGKVERQVTVLRKIVAAAPTDAAARENLGLALALSHAYEEAARELAAAQSDGVATANLAAAQGFAGYLMGDIENAAPFLSQALDEGTTVQQQAQLRLALLLARQGQYGTALPHFNVLAGGTGETAVVAKFFHGMCLALSGRHSDALIELEALGLQRGPFAVEASLQAAHLYLVNGDIERAREAIRRADEYGGSGPALETLRGRVEAATGQFRPAQEAFKRAILADENYAPAYLENGLVYIKREVFSEGIQQLEKYLTIIDPDMPGAHGPEVEMLVAQLKQTLGAATSEQAAGDVSSERSAS
ncbi:MAG TPA: tetratricopeptide repeat protein [Candidatus Hydrogenedentes bacterium]|nr:tetratricopeptide repeat protein [Candidatus Hydrogenedentota bacterium]HPG68019.1 tetratricopeptide repeat protein [Candidatus Hydrogenedentota bacterium]